MKRALKKHWFEISISTAVLVLAMVGISLLFGYAHRTNDDVFLRSIASGNYTGTPDAHLIYILYPLGLILKALYSVAGNVSWYDLFVIALHYFCWWALLVRIAAKFERKWHKVAAIFIGFLALIILDLPNVVLNQYTALAGVCAATAVLWMTLLDAGKKEGIGIQIFVITALMIITLWLRKEVFFMALPIGGCILLYQWLSHGKEKEFKTEWLRTHAVLVGVIAVIGTASLIVDYMAYTDDEWKKFKEYNEARTEIFDYYGLAPYDLNLAAYEEEGIGIAEYEVVNSMSLALIPEADAAKLDRLAELAKQNKEEAEQYYNVYRQTMYAVCDVLFYNEVQPMGIVLTFASAVLLTILLMRRCKAGVVAMLAALAYEAVFVGYFVWKNRFPERVSFGLFCMLLFLFVGIMLMELRLSKEEKPKKDYFWRIVPLSVVAFVLVNVVAYQYQNTTKQVEEYKLGIDQWQQIQNYVDAHPDNVYLIKSNIAGVSGDAMHLRNTKEPVNILLLGTWLLESPHYTLRSERLGLDVIGEDYVKKDNIYVMQSGDEAISWLTDYYAGCGSEAQAVEVDVIETKAGPVSVVEMRIATE